MFQAWPCGAPLTDTDRDERIKGMGAGFYERWSPESFEAYAPTETEAEASVIPVFHHYSAHLPGRVVGCMLPNRCALRRQSGTVLRHWRTINRGAVYETSVRISSKCPQSTILITLVPVLRREFLNPTQEGLRPDWNDVWAIGNLCH